jgi:hypothetical protein
MICLLDSVGRFLFLGKVDYLDLHADTILRETKLLPGPHLRTKHLQLQCQNLMLVLFYTIQTRREGEGGEWRLYGKTLPRSQLKKDCHQSD